jgi:hypothetical protein
MVLSYAYIITVYANTVKQYNQLGTPYTNTQIIYLKNSTYLGLLSTLRDTMQYSWFDFVCGVFCFPNYAVSYEQDRQCTYNATLTRVRETIVAVEKQ